MQEVLIKAGEILKELKEVNPLAQIMVFNFTLAKIKIGEFKHMLLQNTVSDYGKNIQIQELQL